MAISFFRRFRPVSSLRLLGQSLSVALLVAGCHPAPPAITNPKDPKFVVAEKGTWQITRADLDGEINGYLKQHQVTAEQVGGKMPLLETAMLDNMVLKKLLLDKAGAMQLTGLDKEEGAELDALKQRIPPGQDFDAQLKAAGMSLEDLKKRIHEKVLITHVLQGEALKNVQPTDQEINDVYVKNKDRFNTPPKERASRVLILVDAKDTPAQKAAKKKAIDKARARVAKGEDFSKVAMEVSQDRYSAPRGGDIGYIQRGENADAGFDDVAFTTPVNTLSAVFETSLGYQFLKVTASQPGGVVPVADARDFIAKKLAQLKTQQQEEAYTKQLLADGKVTYHITRAVPPPPDAGASSSGPGVPATNAPSGAAPGTNAPVSVSTPPMAAPGTNGAPAAAQ